MLRAVRSLPVAGVLALLFVLVLVASASAAWGGPDPAANTRIGLLPGYCRSAPTGKDCIDTGVYYLDLARKRSGLLPYALPADFPSLSPPRQIFILVNLDRIAYGLPPIPGMTAALDHDALVSGVRVADDPHPSNTTGLSTWWPGWAGAFDNAPMAYEGWVWDDGLGSNNPRCTPTDHSRCWGHRHSALWKFGAGSVLAMGAAAGRDSSHHRGYAYIYVGGSSAYHPAYTYTWSQAVADGAGTNTYKAGPSPRARCHVPAVFGLALAKATSAIEKVHCAVGTVRQAHSGYGAGTVADEFPTPGLTFAPGKKVKLILSLGPG